jgi:hypothetical protein
MAAVVLPLPGPVLISISPRRESVITDDRLQMTDYSEQPAIESFSSEAVSRFPEALAAICHL